MLSRNLMRSARLPALSRTTIARPTASRISSPMASIWVRGMAKNRNRNQNQNQKQNQQSRPNQNQPSARPAQPAQSAPAAQSAQSAQPTQSQASQAPTPKSESTPSAKPSQSAEAEAASKSEPDLSSLPDLTQGIPSTLEYETSGATDKAALSAIKEETPESQSGGGRARGELPASAYISSTEKKRMRLANWMYAGSLVFGALGVAYLGREWDEEEEKIHTDIPNGWSFGLWYKRMMARFGDVTSYYSEPAFDKLLPDPDPMFARPYTLCISLEDMLVHSEWTREHGWRVAKRPGVDYFLRYLSQYYELVLFTSVPFAIGEPLVRKLDPFRFIVWPLFREATKYKDGEIVKDLSYLNRDLSKVIIIDSKAEHVRNQPENAIVLNKWTGDPKDTELVSLIPFLEYIHTMQYKDVRTVIKSFDGKHIPTEFARREAIARKEFQKQFESEKRKRASGMGALGGLLGLKPGNMSMMVPAEGEISPSEAFAQGKMLQDIARERGQRNYEMMEKEIRENGEKWLKEEQAANEKAQAEAMSSMKSSFTSWFVPSKPEENPNPAPSEAQK